LPCRDNYILEHRPVNKQYNYFQQKLSVWDEHEMPAFAHECCAHKHIENQYHLKHNDT
jgi:hypothetical protein